MLWFIQYDGSVDEEEVLIPEFRQRQNLYVKEQLDDIVDNTKQPVAEGSPPNPPLLTTEKSNIKHKRLDTSTETATKKKKTAPPKKKTPTRKKMKKKKKKERHYHHLS